MHINRVIKFVISVAMALAAGIYIVMQDSLIMAKLISLDTLALATYVFGMIVFRKDNSENGNQHLIDRCGELYVPSTVNRYIFYIFVQVVYKIICTLIGIPSVKSLEYSLLITVVPIVINYIFANFTVIQQIIKVKQNIIKILIAKMLALVVKYGSLIYLELDITVKDKEFREIIGNYDKAKDIMFQILKNVGALCIISLVRLFTSNNFYYAIATGVYNYNADPSNKIETIAVRGNDSQEKIKEYKRRIISVVRNKEWGDLIKPTTLKILYQLYVNRDNTSNDFDKFVTNVITTGFWTSIIWSFSGWLTWINVSQVESSSIVPVALSIIIHFMKDDVMSITKLVTILFGGLLGHFINVIPITCFLCEYTYLLLVNKIMISIAKYSIKKLGLFLKKLYFTDIKNNIYLLTNALLYLTIDMKNAAFYPIIILLNISSLVLNYHLRLVFVYVMPLLFGYFSDYDMLHLVKIFGITFTLMPLVNNGMLFSAINSISDIMTVVRKKYQTLISGKNSKVVLTIKDCDFMGKDFLTLATSPVNKQQSLTTSSDGIMIVRDMLDGSIIPKNDYRYHKKVNQECNDNSLYFQYPITPTNTPNSTLSSTISTLSSTISSSSLITQEDISPTFATPQSLTLPSLTKSSTPILYNNKTIYRSLPVKANSQITKNANFDYFTISY